MSIHPADYEILVLQEIKTYDGLSHPVKAGLAERLFTRKLNIDRLHPNPTDEFCDPDIGPNYEIISRYCDDWRLARQYNQQPELGRLCVEKMSTGGYMLLDGHHRWYAAHRMGYRMYPVEIMNVTPFSQVLAAVEQSERRLCVSFDLDEVLLTDAAPLYSGKRMPLSFPRFMKTALRKNAGAMIDVLHEMGFDVWVYTGSFIEETKLNRIFAYHGVKVDGIVNGLKNRAGRSELKKVFAEKYELSLHIDAESVLWVDTRTKEFDAVDLECDENDWSAKVTAAVRALPEVTRRLKYREDGE